MSNQQLKTEILSCLRQLQGGGKFASLCRSDFIFPGLRVDGLGEISFPLNDQQAKALIQIAEKAPFGQSGETILDPQVRSAWQIDATQLSFQNPQWAKFLEIVLEKVKKDLGLQDYEITAQLYKFLLYQQGDFFLTHKDSEKEKGMFGSLIINLPSYYTGGELYIRFEGEEVCADFAEDAANYKIDCAAFYADCDHEIKPLTSGYRICLVYNLIQQKAAKKIGLQSSAHYVNHLVDILKRYPSDQPYIILLGHQYTPENFAHDALKLNDRYKADVLLKAAEKMGYYAKLCLVTAYQLGIPVDDGFHYKYGEDEGDENAEMEEIIEEELSIDYWLDSKYPHLTHINFTESDLITSFAVDDGEPIVKEATGYMGNYGPDLMHWYHHGAVILWSPEQNAKLLPQQRIYNKLEWIAYFNQTQKASTEEINTINQILDTGFSDRYDQAENFNAVLDWLIWQNNQTFLEEIEFEYVQILFTKIDAVYWQKLLHWLPIETRSIFFAKFTTNVYPGIIEKLLTVIKLLIADPQLSDLMCEQVGKLPDYFAKSQPSIQLSKTALADLFLIETRILPDQQWTNAISQVMTKHLDWAYIHTILVPQLLAEKKSGKIHTELLHYSQQYLQQRVDQQPKPPENWCRALPDTNTNSQVWEMLRAFMQSPTEQFFDYKKIQSERTMLENVIRNERVDLGMETIRKGSPHTLRLIKTQATYERQLDIWHQDVALLMKVKKKSNS